MSIFMGVSLSFCLSLFGNLTSGHFTIPGFLLSLVFSIALSMLVSFFVPIKKLGDSACKKAGIPDRSAGGAALSALISDLIFTPLMTLSNVGLAFMNAAKHGAQTPPFAVMFFSSLWKSLIIAYFLVLILSPLYLKLVLKMNGISPQGGPPPETKK